MPTSPGFGYVYTDGAISLDPVLRIEDATFEMQSVAFKYIHSFELLDKSARFELTQAYQEGTWSGLLDGVPTSVDRSGWGDTVLRFAVNLFGAPPLRGEEFAAYRAGADRETIVGVGLAVVLPTGEYFDDRLINLGGNRFTLRPQLGVVHNWGHWSVEFTAATWMFTDNDDFFNGNRLEQDPLVALQGHLIYTFRPGLWLGASLGYGFGGRSTVNGDAKNDRRNQLSWALSLGLPVNRNVGVKLAYVGSRSEGTDRRRFRQFRRRRLGAVVSGMANLPDGAGGPASLHHRRHRHRETETRSAVRAVLRPEFSLVCLDDALRHGQAHSHAGGLGGEERLEQASEGFGGDPRTVVANPDFDGVRIRLVCGHPDVGTPRMHCIQRVHGIDEQVEQNLLEVDPVATDHGQARRDGGDQLHMTGGRIGVDQRQDRGDDVREIDRLQFESPFLEQGSKPVDHLARPLVIAQDVADNGAQFLEIGRGIPQHDLGGLGVAQDGRRAAG